jgi:hypothetical protein
MFDTITEAELGMLRSKLYSAGHQFADVAHTIGKAAMLLPILGAEHDAKWAERRRYSDAMTEVYELAEESEVGPETLFGTNPYEAACERFARINRNRAKIIADAQATIEWAEQEWEDAQNALAAFESKPGIPLPQYRGRLDGCTCNAVAGSHKPPCAWAAGSWDFAAPAKSVRLDG